MSQDNNKKNITDGVSFFTQNDLFKKKENLYLLNVFGLSVLLFVVVGGILTTKDGSISYLLSLISSVLVINGYNKVKKESKQ
ncbi:hypothetical protein JMF89_06685 [Clostridiaceae bacterium UIB06]|uniref:Uncharacterized protein n=1 Tax=Clostridium thailandense TaxID=2794346 RepID=A0A949TWM4_9CLOT|nr:hypothetical protein [Clostridium thailandense]MBV7273848.1 hypothetical protein [Clostridium thailandense]MCH5136887.1 hypothetical protein [Clostridiaceae bacterium UIB06]